MVKCDDLDNEIFAGSYVFSIVSCQSLYPNAMVSRDIRYDYLMTPYDVKERPFSWPRKYIKSRRTVVAVKSRSRVNKKINNRQRIRHS